MTAEEVFDSLVSQEVATRSFEVARSLCRIVSETGGDSAHELVLRALDQRESFGGAAPIIDALVREIGLFPYLDRDKLGLADRIAYEFHRPGGLDDGTVFHHGQAEIFRYLVAGKNVVLSAPTSFGKSLLIDAVIANRDFKNICVIVPSVALIDETRRRLQRFSNRYKIITQVNQPSTSRNIYVLTQERAVERGDLDDVDFFVIDEFYKLDIDEYSPERGITLNRAFYRLLQNGAQFYLLGPNIQKIPQEFIDRYNCIFLEKSYTTVVSEVESVMHDGTEDGRLSALIQLLKDFREPTMVYCRSPLRLNRVVQSLITELDPPPAVISREAVKWFSTHYHGEWQFLRALQRGVGIHHGRIPRSLSQYSVRLFNEAKVRILLCTSSLIEGVNTSAKNVIIYDGTINTRKLDFFTFRNISGRAGRMRRHLVGRVFVFDTPPPEQDKVVNFPLLSQGAEVPTQLFLGMARADLKKGARARVDALATRGLLSLESLARNSPVDPEHQLRLAEHIEENINDLGPDLSWSGNPQYKDLRVASRLIWQYLAQRPERTGGARTYGQLTWRIHRLRHFKSDIGAIVDDEVGDTRYPRTPDEIVTAYLDVLKNWVQYRYPRLLMTLDRIQREVLPRFGFQPGDYSVFAAQSEHLFTNAVYVALDEYGLPIQIASKLRKYLLRGDDNDVDAVLARLKSLDTRALPLSRFERQFVNHAKKNAPDTLFTQIPEMS